MNIDCLIVDDEPLALDILEKYIGNIPQLQLIGRCADAFKAIDIMREKVIDLIFLDINMPELSGISMIRSLEDPPLVVFTTAYPEHAVEGFELDAVDYLVKPFSFERFVKAVNRVRDKLTIPKYKKMESYDFTGFLSVKADKKIYKVDHEHVLFIQAYGDFSKIHTHDGVIICSDNLKKLEGMLPEHLFLRIHKSYLISLLHVEYIEGNMVNMKDHTIPIGASFRENLLSRIRLQ
jgi:DNA-binding LytR/AlgR family response regulator